jgi:hypothetical protein
VDSHTTATPVIAVILREEGVADDVTTMHKTTVLLLTFVFATLANGQQKREVRFPVSYISASVVYIDAGKQQRIGIGDTLKIVRNGTAMGLVKVIAVSNHSCAAQPLAAQSEFAVGDMAVSEQRLPPDDRSAPGMGMPDSSIAAQAVEQPVLPVARPSPQENLVSGRVGLQYSGVFAEDSRFNASQPSALIRLDIANVLGTGMAFAVYSRNYYDLSNYYRRYGETSRLKNRVYEFSLQQDQPNGLFGYGVGRMTSRFVGAIGPFDGGQFYLRQQNFSAGVLYGARVGERAMEVDGDDRRGAVFVNYHAGTDFYHLYDGTVAYARQLFGGSLDREFLSTQHTLSLGPELSLFGSSEVELNDMHNGIRSRAFTMSSMFIFVNYYPERWISANLGYDATRNVYLFETMKAFPDTLFDKNILQGVRSGVTVRLPHFIMLSLNGTYRTKKNDARDSYKIDVAGRMSDIAGTDASAGLRYARIIGVYTNGNNVTVDFDRPFFGSLSVSMRYEYFAYTFVSLQQSYTTHTVTANLNYRISRALYSSLTADRIWDPTMNSYRVYGEIGIRF